MRQRLATEDVHERAVLEVGSREPAGLVRGIIERLAPREYLGVDVAPGPGVDEICAAEAVLERFGAERFDVVVCAEVLEHVRDWRAVAHNLKRVLAPDGVLVATTRAPGFEFHGYPLDFWRYSQADISTIFGDLEIEAVEDDADDPPGVFFRARRPARLHELDLEAHRLYSVVRRRPAATVTPVDVAAARALAAGQAASAHCLPPTIRDGIRRGIERSARRRIERSAKQRTRE